MKKKPTIQMVAEKAGVSRGTVDRVLNNRSHVSPDVHDRVMKAIQETGYLSPRQAYQTKLSKVSYPKIKLGVLLPNWTGHFKTEVLRGIEAARSELEDFHVEIILKECQTDIPGEVIELLDELLDEEVKGIAMCAINNPSIETHVSALTENNFPVITLNSDLPDSKRLCFIGQDYNKSGRIAAELLSKCIPSSGNILAAVGSLEFDGHRTRLEGFLERMGEVGFQKDQIQVIETYNDYQTTFRKVSETIQQNPNICGIYMANRSVAGCTEAVSTLGIKGSIKIICHDISEDTKRLLQNGSIDFTISQDIFRQGYLPMIYLRDYLQKGKLPATEETSTNISIICSQNIENT